MHCAIIIIVQSTRNKQIPKKTLGGKKSKTYEIFPGSTVQNIIKQIIGPSLTAAYFVLL